jgi:hypothetical protein
MSDKNVPNIPPGILTPEQVELISGGGTCTPEQINSLIPQLRQSYEGLIDFTVYMLERVSGK